MRDWLDIILSVFQHARAIYSPVFEAHHIFHVGVAFNSNLEEVSETRQLQQNIYANQPRNRTTYPLIMHIVIIELLKYW